MPAISLQLDNEELAATYDRSSTLQFNHGKILIGSLDLKPGERVLDVGAGTGRLGEYVANLVGPEGEVVGIDPLPLRVDIASRREGNFRAQVGRAEDLSAFADGSFDVVYLNSVFHWVADKPKALSEIRRVLRRGGRLGVNSADASRPHQSAAILRELLLEEGLGDHNSGTNLAVDADGVRRLLDAAGFVQVEVRNHLFVDFHDNVDELLAWSRSSSFGNFLTNLGPEGKAQIRDRLAARLEPLRTPNGIRLERYLVFATAAKPG